KPPLTAASRLERDDLAVEPDRQLKATRIEGAPEWTGEPIDGNGIAMCGGGGVVLVVYVHLNIVCRGRSDLAHCLPTAALLMFGSRQEAHEIVGIGADQAVTLSQGVVEMRLVKQSEPSSEVDALGNATEILDRFDDRWPDRGPIADRPPRLEVVGVKIGKA